jgi:hypothetical protein
MGQAGRALGAGFGREEEGRRSIDSRVATTVAGNGPGVLDAELEREGFIGIYGAKKPQIEAGGHAITTRDFAVENTRLYERAVAESERIANDGSIQQDLAKTRDAHRTYGDPSGTEGVFKAVTPAMASGRFGTHDILSARDSHATYYGDARGTEGVFKAVTPAMASGRFGH